MMLVATEGNVFLFREGPRYCRDCGNLSPGRRCLMSAAIDPQLPRDFYPRTLEARYCTYFQPYPGDADDRIGHNLWPGLRVVASLPSTSAEIRRAMLLVADCLAEHDLPANRVLELGSLAGIHPRSIQRASMLLGVTRYRTRFGGVWLWSLTAMATSSHEVCSPKGLHNS